jgi:hypothetical protein
MATVEISVKADPKRLIRGDLIKIVDGRASIRDGTPVPDVLLVAGIFKAAQRWQAHALVDVRVETPETPLPDVDDLNNAVPSTEWEIGLDGAPTPPWRAVWGLYFIDPKDASPFTWLAGSIGGRIAHERINERIAAMKMFRGQNVAPIVKVTNRSMKTKFGTRLRPEFEIVRWVELAGGNVNAAPAIENKPAATPAPELKTVGPVTTREAINDPIPR